MPRKRQPSSDQRIGAALERIATVLEKACDKLWPEPKPKRKAEVTRPDEEKRRELGDYASPEWFEETEQAVPSRFAKRLEQTEKGKQT